MPNPPARALSVLLATCLSLVGCGGGTGAGATDGTVASSAASTARASKATAGGEGVPVTVTGHDGVRVELPGPPARVVPASAGLVDLVCALLPPGRVAGLPGQALAYSALRDPASPYLQRPTFEVYAAEPVLALEPDLVLADAWQAPETSERLRAAGVPVLVLGRLERLSEACDALDLLSRVLGTGEAGAALVEELHARAAALRAAGAHRKGWRAVSYVNGGTGGWVAGRGTTPDEWIGLTGMTNAAADREGHARCSFEELLAMDPDLIVVSGRAAYDDMGGTAGLLRREAAVSGLRAVREERLVVLDPWLYNTLGLHAVQAAEALAAAADVAMGAGR